jgi:anti-sigma B factor antagonist
VNNSVFTLHELGDGPVAEVAAAGEIDATNADDFVESIAALPGARPVILELSGLQYLDSAGFAALDRLLAQGAAVIVVSPESPVHRAAQLMELPFHHDAEAARRELQRR